MYASTRLSVADARAIIGLPIAKGLPADSNFGALFDQRTASPLGVDTVVPVLEPGSTLKARFAALARNNEASRKETRARDRALAGRRANLEERRGDARDARIPSAMLEESVSLPLQRCGYELYRYPGELPTPHPEIPPLCPAFGPPACKCCRKTCQLLLGSRVVNRLLTGMICRLKHRTVDTRW